jgi:hypothetical protein
MADLGRGIILLSIAIVILHWAAPEIASLITEIAVKILTLANDGIDFASANVR